jgi:hypothetical protein
MKKKLKKFEVNIRLGSSRRSALRGGMMFSRNYLITCIARVMVVRLCTTNDRS